MIHVTTMSLLWCLLGMFYYGNAHDIQGYGSKTVLVTGGAGFLGSHLCKALLGLGHRVIAVDNLYTGSIENIQSLLGDNNFSFIQHDITSPIDFGYPNEAGMTQQSDLATRYAGALVERDGTTDRSPEGNPAIANKWLWRTGSEQLHVKIDWIFNFACPASPPHYQKDPIFTTKTSVLGALNMLELARKHNARIMQSSTSEVYGDPLVHPQVEDYWGNVSCNGPRACYDEGKRCAESLFFDYHRMYNLEIKVIRIFNTYGPNMDPKDGRVVSNFIMQALRHKPITMYGDGTQTRSFCYVDDLIAGILAMMNSDASIVGPINLGNPQEFTLLELASTIQKLLGSNVPLDFKPLPKDDPTRRKPDITRAQNILNWEPKIPLHEGLQRTIEYFQKRTFDTPSTLVIVGAGYVGLVTGACFAQKGHRVIIVENDQEKIAALVRGKVPFFEPYLDSIVANVIATKRLAFTSTIQQGLAHKPNIIFLCVGTPPKNDGSADLSYIEHVAQEIGAHLNDYALVVNKSTVPVGTGKMVAALIEQQLALRNQKIDFDVASNPEFLKEGSAVHDFLTPDRIVIGAESERAALFLYDLYKPFITNISQFLCMNIQSAELSKYASNAMLATRISFMNQLAQLADNIGADIQQVKNGMAKDQRIGPSFLNAGIGYGGSCFAKDVSALVHIGQQNNVPMTLVQEVETINQEQLLWFINKIHDHYGPEIANKTVGIWGLSFKPDTDDIRCAPALAVIDDLAEKNATIIAYDPVAGNNIKKIYGNNIRLAQNAADVLDQADFLIILTEWKEFLDVPLDRFLKLRDKVIFDGRNCYNPLDMCMAGISYFCVGRNSLTKI